MTENSFVQDEIIHQKSDNISVLFVRDVKKTQCTCMEVVHHELTKFRPCDVLKTGPMKKWAQSPSRQRERYWDEINCPGKKFVDPGITWLSSYNCLLAGKKRILFYCGMYFTVKRDRISFPENFELSVEIGGSTRFHGHTRVGNWVILLSCVEKV